jgi:hypothetical protein
VSLTGQFERDGRTERTKSDDSKTTLHIVKFPLRMPARQ